MIVCPACQHKFDNQHSARCPQCGAVVGDPAEDLRATQATGSAPGAEPRSEGSIDLELTAGSDASAPNDATVEFSGKETRLDLPKAESDAPDRPPRVGSKTPTVTDDSSATMEFESGEVSQMLDSEQAEAGRATQGELKKPTHAINRDLTVDLGAAAAVDADLSLRMTGEWGDAILGNDDQRQTFRQEDSASGSIKDSIGDFRSSLPIRSRSVHDRIGEPAPRPISSADAPDYELLKRIGEGGMGVVYAAHQSSIARTVAIKMLKPGVKVTADQRDKFLSEAVVTGDLDHPNIVPIYDLGANDQGALFYAMKRVKGTPWDDVFQDKSADENLSILMRVADALAFAHASGVVHRDLKPENVMLGDFGEVLVMDWGLARVTSKFRNAGAVYQSDSLGGTPAYMAPEMARGPIELIDARSDVYLLGAMLYEIVTGEPPHTGDDVMQCLMSAAQNKITPADPQVVQGRSELLAIALKAMETRPADRHQSVKEFQTAVREYQSHSESLVLSTLAEQRLEEAQKTNDYALYSSALFGFQESLTLWPENQQAAQLHRSAETAYARAALDKGDFDLGASLLKDTEGDAEQIALLEKLDTARAERDARQRRLRNAKRLAAALVAAVVAITTFSYFAVRQQRNAAIAARQEAETQRERAEENEEIAITEKQIADVQRQAAVAAREQEATARAAAEQAREEADAARQQEAAQRQIAEQAKRGEEYESYVAQIGLAAEKIEENAFDSARLLLEQCRPERLRHWEWGRLAYLCQLSPQSYLHQGPVDTIQFSPDGSRLLAGDWTGRLLVRDVATGEEVFSVRLGEYVYAAAYSPDGKRIAAGSSDGRVRILDANEGNVLQTLSGNPEGVLGVAFSPDGSRLLSGGYDEKVRLWDLATGEQLDEGANHTWWVWSVEFSPAGDTAVSTSQDGRAIVWRLSANGRQLQQQAMFTEHHGPVYGATYSPKGDQIATAGYDGTVRIWAPEQLAGGLSEQLDPATQQTTPHTVLKGHQKPVRVVAFSDAGDKLLSGGADNTVRLWDATTGQAIQSLRGHGSRVMAAAFSPDGKQAASGGYDQTVRLWDLAGYEEERVLMGRVFRGHADAVLSARFSTDGKQIITASRDRTANLWETATGEPLQSFEEGHEFLASTARFFNGGRRLATGAGDNTVRLWDVASGAEYASLRPTGRTAALAVAAEGTWVVTGGRGNLATVWDATTGDEIASLAGHQAEVTAAAVAKTGAQLPAMIATGDERGLIRLWKRTADEWIAAGELKGHSRTITGLAFSNQGRRLVSSSGDNTCGQWDTQTQTELRDRVLKHGDWVAALALSADGQTALTCCDDGFARLWQLETATVIAQTEAPGAVFTAVDLSPSGDTALLTSAADRSVLAWRVSEGGDAEQPQALLSRENLRGDVWASRFAGGGEVLTIGGNDATLWDVSRQRATMRFSPHGAVASAALSATGKLVATGSWDHSIKIWDAATGNAIQKVEDAHDSPLNSVAFAPASDTHLLTASDDRTAAEWDLGAPGQPITVFSGHQGRVEHAAYSADGKRVVTASSDRTARVWDRQTGRELLTLSGHDWGLMCCEFSADGSRIVTGGEDNRAVVWDAATGAQQQVLLGHTAPVTSVAFSPDGLRVLTGSQDGAAKLWDAITGKEILTIDGHDREVTSVVFSPDGQQALTAGRDGAAILWLAEPWQSETEANKAATAAR